MSKIESSLRQKLEKALAPAHLEIENESQHHALHITNPKVHEETHFKIIVVSSKFEGLPRIARQRLVNDLFREEREWGLHALTMKTLTPKEWEEGKLSR